MTRIVFLILVIANVMAFIWYGWLQSPAQTPSAFTPLPQVQPLRLIAELTPAEQRALGNTAAPRPSLAHSAKPSVSPPAAEDCASYGPFPSSEAAETAGARLQKAGASATQRLVPGKVRQGYWVYLPPFGSRREADAAAALLKQRGVKDLYVVTDEANRNAISLGVYRDRYGALAHQKKIRQLGYRALVTERFRDAPRYWLDAQGTATALPPAGAFADLDEDDVAIGRATCGAAPGP